MTYTYDKNVAGYTYHASIYCDLCGYKLPDIDPEGNPKHIVFSWDETGYESDGEWIPDTCENCGDKI